MAAESESESDKADVDLLLTQSLVDYGWRSLSRATSHFERIESKTARTASLIALVLALSSISGGFEQINTASVIGKIVFSLFCATAAFLFVALYKCLRAMVIREVKEPSPMSEMIGLAMKSERSTENYRSHLKEIVNRLSESQAAFTKAAKNKAEILNSALNCLRVAFGFAVATAIGYAVQNRITMNEESSLPDSSIGHSVPLNRDEPRSELPASAIEPVGLGEAAQQFNREWLDANKTMCISAANSRDFNGSLGSATDGDESSLST